ncbi:uncharacterized protein LAESUDRAFT_566465 [Laetiporus sulphureus 93-53]|uniref:Uncharacterized protein n=1 Tax=Laetiporus sulphureus 93-53 TaxID=1314785 RepID=A0A165FGE6_9APHY|nr:uncharacterized protein LAESUDRAFT_566465 [Laetiporus sulphureus 93-53]KZT08931.1 hypothetical protein LAESUDRAFT_566465 [Laetiporus sulphureus 93-53]
MKRWTKLWNARRRATRCKKFPGRAMWTKASREPPPAPKSFAFGLCRRSCPAELTQLHGRIAFPFIGSDDLLCFISTARI